MEEKSEESLIRLRSVIQNSLHPHVSTTVVSDTIVLAVLFVLFCICYSVEFKQIY